MENFRDNLMICMKTICLEKVLLHFSHTQPTAFIYYESQTQLTLLCEISVES